MQRIRCFKGLQRLKFCTIIVDLFSALHQMQADTADDAATDSLGHGGFATAGAHKPLTFQVAEQGGGVVPGLVGHAGGEQLVRETLKNINKLFAE